MTTKPRSSRLPLVLIVLGILAGGGAIGWHKVVRHYFVARNFGVVEDGAVYRSGRIKPIMVRKLHERYGIATIIDLGAYAPGSEEDLAEQAVAEELGMTRHSFHLVGDGTGDPNGYVQAVRLMADPANQPVLVHCAAGAQRTGTAVILYRHLVQGRPIAETIPEAIEHKHDPGGNWRLLAYLAENLGVMEESYRTGRPIVTNEQGRFVLGSAQDAAAETADATP